MAEHHDEEPACCVTTLHYYYQNHKKLYILRLLHTNMFRSNVHYFLIFEDVMCYNIKLMKV